MAHSENIISSIKLPDGSTYEIHDAKAIHDVSELGLSAALVFKGTKPNWDSLPTTGNKVGDVWLLTDSGKEYVWLDDGSWEPLGFTQDAASSTHTHNVTVTGTNSSSAVTGTVVVPTVTATKKYISASLGTVAKEKVLGAGTTFTVAGGATSTTSINNPTVTAVNIPNVTENTSVTASKVTTTDVSIPNVTGNSTVTASKVTTTAGKAASWEASVTNGVLSFAWSANTPTAVSATDVSASKVTLGTALSASKVSATDVNASKVTLGTAIGASKVAITPVDVSTGHSAITVTANENNQVEVVKSIDRITMAFSASETDGSQAVVSDVSIGSTNSALVNGTAAAQTWTQKSGTTGTPK